MKHILCAILISLALVGCSTKRVLYSPVSPPSIPMVSVPVEVLAPCASLNEGPFKSFEEIQTNYADVLTKYVECAGKQHNSTRIIQEFMNIYKGN